MKNIKNFESFGETFMLVAAGWFFYKFMKGLIKSRLRNKEKKSDDDYLNNIINLLKDIKNIPVNDFNDRYFMRVNLAGKEYDIRLFKETKMLNISGDDNFNYDIKLTENDFNNFLKIIGK